MVPNPVVLGLAVCEQVIVEEKTKNVTLVSCFTKLRVDAFPSPPQRLAVFAAFRDGHGTAKLELVIFSTESGEEIDAIHSTIQFPDRLTEVRAVFHLRRCVFPAPGRYLFTIRIDGEWMAQREIKVEMGGLDNE